MHDNPAARLGRLLEHIATADKQATASEVLKIVFVTTDDSEVIRQLAQVLALPAEIAELISTLVAAQAPKIVQWRAPLENGIRNLRLNAPIQDFRGQYNDATISYLQLLGELLHEKQPFEMPEADQIKLVMDNLVESIDLVKQAEIPVALRRHVVIELHQLLNALRDVKISGGRPILRQVESLSFHASVDSEFKDFCTKSEVGARVVQALQAAAALITMGANGPRFLETVKRLFLS